MKCILVATDFSEASLNAVYYASDMAVSIKARLILLHVYAPAPTSLLEVPLPPVQLENDLHEIEIRLESLKKNITDRTSRQLHVDSIIRVGKIRSEISTVADEYKPVVVIMASHGMGTIERLLLGSNTQWATKHLSWPLIIVPRFAVFQTVTRIGLAWNFRPLKDTTFLQRTKELLAEFKAELHVVYAMKDRSGLDNDQFKRELDNFNAIFSSLHPQFSFIATNDITLALIGFSESKRLDMLIILPARHHGLFHHSQTTGMARNSHRPLLTLHE
jgi:nucleotide-binding universal stress UspA family protein